MVSIITVNFRGGKFVSLLLESLRRTIPRDAAYEVIVVNNFHAGYRCTSTIDRWWKTVRHYVAVARRGRGKPLYGFRRPDGMRIRELNTAGYPVFWSPSMNIRGKATSVSHATALAAGHRALSPDTRFVLLLDTDVVLLTTTWWQDFHDRFKDPKLVALGTLRCEKYQRPFLRPHCLMFRLGFFHEAGDLYRATDKGDVASRIAYFAEDQGARLHVFQNSVNDPSILPGSTFEGWGESAIDDGGRVFYCHGGHERTVTWDQWMERMGALVQAL